MSDFERVIDICANFYPVLRKFFFTPAPPFWREPLESIRTRCWYESLKQRYQLSRPVEMERRLEPDAFSTTAKGRPVSKNKWRRFRDGGGIRQKTVEKVEKNAPGSMRIFKHPLWEVLDFESRKVMEGEGLLKRLSAELQVIIFKEEQSGIVKYLERAPINRSLLKKIELIADLDALACLTWLLREAAENKNSSTGDIGRSLHKVLTMMALELHALNIGLPLLQHFIDRVLPLALPRHHRMSNTSLDYMFASSVLNELAFSVKGSTKMLDWKSRVKNMVRWLNGEFGLDVLYAMRLQTARDENSLWAPAKVKEELKSSARLRDNGWAEFLGEVRNMPSCCKDLRISYIGSSPVFAVFHILNFHSVTPKARNFLLHPYVRTASYGIIKLARYG